jgi:hypothetical protein
MPETLLRWLSADEQSQLDGQRLRPPKDLRLQAVWDIDRPSLFTVYEWHDSWIAHLRKKWRNRPFAPDDASLCGNIPQVIASRERPSFVAH